MSIPRKKILTFLVPWLLLTIITWIVAPLAHVSGKYFTLGFGITSIITLIALWRSGAGKFADSSASVLVAVAAISLKMFACAVIFVFYFYKHKKEIEPALVTGSVLFILYTLLEVFYGLYWGRRNR